MPSNIKFQNLTYSKCKRFLRNLVSFILALILIVLAFSVTVAERYASEEFINNYDVDVNCQYITNYDDYENIIRLNKTEIEQKLTNSRINCFCKNKLFNNTNIFDVTNMKISIPKNLLIDSNLDLVDKSINLTSSGINLISEVNGKDLIEVYPCKDWTGKFVAYYSMQVGLIIFIPILNALIVFILTVLTSFERNKTLSSDFTSNMIKCFIVQFINVVVVIIIVNLRIESIYNKNPKFFIFTGKYSDFNPEWYSFVGVVIASSMFINIFSPHISSFIEYIYYSCRRCCDSGCCTDNLSTKTLTKLEYFDLYVGPRFAIEFRYAEVSFNKNLGFDFYICNFGIGSWYSYLICFSCFVFILLLLD